MGRGGAHAIHQSWLSTVLTPPPPAHVLVFATEFHFNVSRRRVPAGVVVLQVVDIGQDDHDLAVRDASGRELARTGVVHAAGRAQLRLRLRPGVYHLFCTVADHAARGMDAVLVVRRRRA
jgi:hypothetical protein